MSLVKTQNFLISFKENQVQNFFESLVFSGFGFEVLDPKELGKEWVNVDYYFPKVEIKDLQKELQILNKVIEENRKSGFLSVFVDDRIEGSSEDLEKAKKNRSNLLEIAELIDQEDNLINQKNNIIEFSRNNQDKKKLFSESFANFIADFDIYINNSWEAIKKLQLQGEIEDADDMVRPRVELESIGEYQVLIFDDNTLEAVKLFISKSEYADLELYTVEEIIQKIDKEISENNSAMSRLGVENQKVSQEILTSLLALHASIQVEISIAESINKVFRPTESSNSIFAIVSVSEKEEEQVKEFLAQKDLPYQRVDWNQEVFDWENDGSLNGFHSIAQSIGTIDNKEVDPTNILALFFVIFFAFCLNDALYGLILSVFTGYFLFFTKLKKEFQSTFSLFFFSGIATIVLGTLTNSWAGNFFNSDFMKSLTGTPIEDSTPIHQFLAKFQLVDVLTPEANLPVNNFLNNELGGASPIIFMMSLAILIGFFNLLVAYMIRIVNSIKRSEYNKALGQFAWVFFIFSAVAYFVMTSQELNFAAQILLGVSVFGLLIFNEAKKFVGKFLGFLFGPRGLYGVVQMGADLMSFTRIIAIGLTGGVIATIVNLLAGMIYEATDPGLGIVLAILILAIGHIFNLVLSLFGAYINPIRLTYVEFMPKFFLGEGRQIQKFSADLDYFRVVEK